MRKTISTNIVINGSYIIMRVMAEFWQISEVQLQFHKSNILRAMCLYSNAILS